VTPEAVLAARNRANPFADAFSRASRTAVVVDDSAMAA